LAKAVVLQPIIPDMIKGNGNTVVEQQVQKVFYQLSLHEGPFFLSIENAIEAITGFDVGDFLSGKVNYFQRIHIDYHTLVSDTILNAHVQRESYELEYLFQHKEGYFIKIKDVARPVCNAGSDIVTFIGELSLNEYSKQKIILDLIHAANVHGEIGVFYYFEESDKVYWSKQLLLLHGIETEPTLQEYWSLVHPEDLEYCLAHFRKLMDDHVGYKILYRIIRRDNQAIRQMISELVPVFDEAGNFTGVSGNTVDITDALNLLSYEPQLLDERGVSNRYKEEDAILIKQNHSLIPVPVNEVVAISALRDYIQIYVKGRSKPFVLYKTLKEMFSTLPEGKFVQIHRSHVVRISEIKKINLSSLMVEEMELPLSRSFRQELKSKTGHLKK
jgi:hypothetical protein